MSKCKSEFNIVNIPELHFDQKIIHKSLIFFVAPFAKCLLWVCRDYDTLIKSYDSYYISANFYNAAQYS